ncbi:hypothetical protein Nepgr_031969 [Nepenthes gracilis]|uniref:Uncharacterized protein n=1 Tax=Nepenthes gracilis TaxID=150966 RepID=A0AAD3TJG2_NEPGR|nr:hypothetical protein Nepgr_031969 [Nepenthes gracilis]
MKDQKHQWKEERQTMMNGKRGAPGEDGRRGKGRKKGPDGGLSRCWRRKLHGKKKTWLCAQAKDSTL